jgi:O-antigen/teichoic acid export membrane protein
MAVNQNPPRLGAHWRLVSWAVLDKSLQLVFGVAFVLLVVRALPRAEFGLQGLASTILLTLSQLFRALLLVPLVKFVGEGAAAGRVAATGAALYVAASVAAAAALAAGRTTWAGLFDKPELAAVLLPSACLLAVGAARDAAVASLEGLRRLRAVFCLDGAYYGLAILGLAAWRWTEAPRAAVAVQWVQAGAAGLGSIVAVVATRRHLLRRLGRAEAGRILRFGGSFLGSGLGATLAQQADALLAGRLLDTGGVASYNLAKQLFRVFNVLAQAINQVLLPVVSRLQAAARPGDLRVLFEKSVCFLTLALLPCCALLAALTGPVLDLLFRGRYADCVPVFQILVASALALPLASVGSSFLVGLGRLGSLLVITWTGLALGIALTLLWIPRWGASGAALAVLVAAAYGAATRAWVLRSILRFRLRDVAWRTRDVVAFARRHLGGGQRRAGGNGGNDQNVLANEPVGSDVSTRPPLP